MFLSHLFPKHAIKSTQSALVPVWIYVYIPNVRRCQVRTKAWLWTNPCSSARHAFRLSRLQRTQEGSDSFAASGAGLQDPRLPLLGHLAIWDCWARRSGSEKSCEMLQKPYRGYRPGHTEGDRFGVDPLYSRLLKVLQTSRAGCWRLADSSTDQVNISCADLYPLAKYFQSSRVVQPVVASDVHTHSG